MKIVATVLSSSYLPSAELASAWMDGELSRPSAGGLYSCVDEPDTPLHRAQLLVHGLPRSLVIERWSAAWVFGALDTKPRETWLCVDAKRRVRYRPRPFLTVREVRLTGARLVRWGAVRVTDPFTTAQQLESGFPDHPGAARAIERLRAMPGADLLGETLGPAQPALTR